MTVNIEVIDALLAYYEKHYSEGFQHKWSDGCTCIGDALIELGYIEKRMNAANSIASCLGVDDRTGRRIFWLHSDPYKTDLMNVFGKASAAKQHTFLKRMLVSLKETGELAMEEKLLL